MPIAGVEEMTLTSLRVRARDETGFSLVSVLASLVAVAALAALAMSSFAHHGAGTPSTQDAAATAGAQDAQATSLAQIAQTALSTYAAGGQSGYAGISPDQLHSIEPQLVTASTTGPYVSSASGTADSYTVSVADPQTHNIFTLTDSSGTVSRTCTTAGNGGCSPSGTW